MVASTISASTGRGKVAGEHLFPYQKRWVKGQSGNPSGKTKFPEELRGIRALTQEEVCRLVAKYGRMLPDQIDALVEARQIPMLEFAIAKIFREAGVKGDFTRLSFLLDRAIGKVPVVVPTDEEEEAIRQIQDMSDQELISLVKVKMIALEKPDES